MNVTAVTAFSASQPVSVSHLQVFKNNVASPPLLHGSINVSKRNLCDLQNLQTFSQHLAALCINMNTLTVNVSEKT